MLVLHLLFEVVLVTIQMRSWRQLHPIPALVRRLCHLPQENKARVALSAAPSTALWHSAAVLRSETDSDRWWTKEDSKIMHSYLLRILTERERE